MTASIRLRPQPRVLENLPGFLVPWFGCWSVASQDKFAVAKGRYCTDMLVLSEIRLRIAESKFDGVFTILTAGEPSGRKSHWMCPQAAVGVPVRDDGQRKASVRAYAKASRNR